MAAFFTIYGVREVTYTKDISGPKLMFRESRWTRWNGGNILKKFKIFIIQLRKKLYKNKQSGKINTNYSKIWSRN